MTQNLFAYSNTNIAQNTRYNTSYTDSKAIDSTTQHVNSLFTTIYPNKPLRSPLFYVGDKYKLMPQLKRLFPKNINVYIEPFVGGGSSFLNTEAKEYWLNDIDFSLISLHTFLKQAVKTHFFKEINELIKFYRLSYSYNNFLPSCRRYLCDKHIKKTYFARFNKEAYLRLR